MYIYVFFFACSALELPSTAGWHSVPLSPAALEATYVLVTVESSCCDRELLLADSAAEPRAELNNETGLWEIHSPVYELQGWKWPAKNHYLSLFPPLNSLTTLGIYLETSNCSHFLSQTPHSNPYSDGSLCPNDCSQHGDCVSARCRCTKGFIGKDCAVQAENGDRDMLVTVERNHTVVIMEENTGNEVEIELIEGEKGEIYTLFEGNVYEIPSDFYFTEKKPIPVSILPKNYPFIFLIYSENVPNTLKITEKRGDFEGLSKLQVIIIGVVVSVTVVFALFLLLLILYLCLKRSKRSSPVELSIVPGKVPVNVDESDQIERLFPLHRYISLNSPVSLVCAVCQEDFAQSSEVRTLPCNHTYHSLCLKRLFEQRWKCVVCAQTYTEMSVQVKLTDSQSQLSVEA